MNENQNNESTSSSIAISMIIGISAFFGYFMFRWIIFFDNNISTTISTTFYITTVLLMIMLVWDKKNKTYIILMPISLLLFILTTIYYQYISPFIEPVIYLHNKYNYNIIDMKIIKFEEATDGFLTEGTHRNATIKINDLTINVYYADGWKDNYQEATNYQKKYKNIYSRFDSIMNKYTKDYTITKDYQQDNTEDNDNGYADYGFIIYLYSTKENEIEQIIEELDNYVASNSKSYIIYGLYITKNKNIYNELKKADITKINPDNTGIYGQTYAADLLEFIGYRASRITYTDGFDKLAFINNGNEDDDEYQNPNKFDSIIFWYESERNAVNNNNNNSTAMQIFGIKR